MARIGPLAGRDIDALWNALRPRIIGLGTGRTVGAQGPAGPKGVNWRGEWAAQTDYEQGDLVYLDTAGGGAAELITYYALDDHTSIAGSPPAPGGTSHWWEIGNAYLIIDGSRAMTGALNMDTHDINNVDDESFSGALGHAQVNNVRQIHLIGDDDDGEARMDGTERIVFNDEPTKSVIENPSRADLNTNVAAGSDYTAAEGRISWDSLEDAFIAYVASGSGVVLVALGWGVLMAANGYNPA